MQGSKPWRYTGKEENMDRRDVKMLVEKWWDVYNDDSLDYKGPALLSPTSQNKGALATIPEKRLARVVRAPSAA
jgi:inositol 3-alpha-galactosyltransferase